MCGYSSHSSFIKAFRNKFGFAPSYYIRNNGYLDNVKETWQKLQTLILNHKIENYKMVALLHDNPAIIHLADCQYIACLITDEQEGFLNKRLPKFNISDGVYAKFDLRGEKEDILRFTHWAYHDWIVGSEYETITKPSFIEYHYVSIKF